MASETETEIKLRVRDLSEIRAELEAAGYCVSQERQFEANTLYDTGDRRLLHSGTLLRLRETGGRSILTWKGPEVPGPHKSRPERETSIGAAETFAYILGQLGYQPVFRYEKFRTELKADGTGGTVTLDETPIGLFIELEGVASWIDETAQKLGFAPTDYITDSYGKLYHRWAEANGVQPSHMVFPSR